MKRTIKNEEVKQQILKSKTFYELLRHLQVWEIDTNGRDFKDALADYIVYHEMDPEIKFLGYDEERNRLRVHVSST